MSPEAGSVTGCGMLTILSGGSMFQPLDQCFGGGASLGEPAGAPSSTHLMMGAICSGVRERSLENLPYRGSASQGGMVFCSTAVRPAADHGFVCSYGVGDIGPASPGL